MVGEEGVVTMGEEVEEGEDEEDGAFSGREEAEEDWEDLCFTSTF